MVRVWRAEIVSREKARTVVARNELPFLAHLGDGPGRLALPGPFFMGEALCQYCLS